MSVLPSIAPARRRTFTPYVIGYLVSALLALAYLTFLGVRPDLVAMWRDKPNDAQTAIVETQRNVERALADLDPIKQGVGEMKMDVDNMKTGMQEAMERDRVLLAKVETLERNVAQASEKVAAAPAAAAPKKVAAATPAAAKPATAAAAKPAAPAATAKSIETGSIEEPKAAAAAKPTPVGVLLATGPSLDSLRLSWQILNDRHGTTMKQLQPRYVVSGKADERTYGLVAGPLANVAAAKDVCKTMADNGISCEVSQYRGNAF
ncbi:MAG: hypothetical protein ABI457_11245 [Hyphomicrobium sp.]